MQYIVKQLPVHLFWDSDISKLDDVEHYEKIIIRTFERGDIEDIATVHAYYGKKICSEVLTESPYLMETAIILGSAFLEVKKEEFKSFRISQYYPLELIIAEMKEAYRTQKNKK
ncbi:MAG: DUF6922 domain-containing protein [Cyclobacteriaceae bacterium]